MRSDDGMMKTLGAATGRTRWGHAAFLALALQIRSAWLLLGAWMATGSAGSDAFFGRIRMMPAHPDWFLPPLVQSAVVALMAVGLARRWRPAWNLLTSALMGSVAFAVTFALVPNGLRDFSLILQSLQEFIAMLIVLFCTSLAWRRLGRWTAVPVVALVGGVCAGVVPLLITYSLFGASWPGEWFRDLFNQVVAVGLLAAVVAVLRGMATAGEDGLSHGRGWQSGTTLGTAGLLALSVVHLVAGFVWSSWNLADSQRLLFAAGLLAIIACWALIASSRASQPLPR